MPQSENIDQLAMALCQLQANIESVEKGEENDGIKKGGKPIKYADLASMVKAAKPHLKECMLAVTGTLGVEILGDQIIDTLETTVMHKSGQWKSGKQRLFLTRKAQGGGLYESLDSQTQGSAISYARRYGFCAILNLITDDDDGQAATTEQRRQVVEGPEPAERPKSSSATRTVTASRNADMNTRDSMDGNASEPSAPPESKTTSPPVPQEEWNKLAQIAVDNGWAPAHYKLSVENEQKRGRHKDERSLFFWATAKFSKKNENAEVTA